jgi:hypothetical protein
MIKENTHEDKWDYNGTNSKGEKKFKRYTNEDLNFAVEFLEKKGVRYEVREGATMVWIYIYHKKYQYYYTTGRWGYASEHSRNLPEHHYHSKGIEDLFDRFLNKEIKKEEHVKLVTTPEQCLSDDIDVCDEECGEILFVGRKLIKQMPKDLLNEFKKHKDTIYHEGYYKITKSLLTREKAIEKYGEALDELGPRGGWRSVMFGTTKFVSKLLK